MDADPELSSWMKLQAERVELALDRFLPAEASAQHALPQAMRHAALGGGKRMRPLLLYAAGELVQAPQPLLDGAACAVELIHAYSLVHDDMPCMDDDDLRRGRPTVHKAFDEATALLAGDALQSLAFEVLSACLDRDERVRNGVGAGAAQVPPAAAMICMLAVAAGAGGMAGGQALDLHSVGHRLELPVLEQMHRQKTGALLSVSVRLGVLSGGIPEASLAKAVDAYGAAIGLAFQVVDDILDVTGDAATLGKTAGKDLAQDKPTYVSKLGLDASRALAEELRLQAQDALLPLGRSADRLRALADRVVFRSS